MLVFRLLTSHTQAPTNIMVKRSVSSSSAPSITVARSRLGRAPTGVKASASYVEYSANEVREESPLTELESDQDLPVLPPKKGKKREKMEQVVYDILPVEKKTTTFKGPWSSFWGTGSLICFGPCSRTSGIRMYSAWC
jgi:hypothetical protein